MRMTGVKLTQRRPARISKLDIKAHECIREKMNARDTILDEITRKQLIWYGHVERMDRTRLPKIMVNWKPEGRKKRGPPRRTRKDGIYTAMGERDGIYRAMVERDGIYRAMGERYGIYRVKGERDMGYIE